MGIFGIYGYEHIPEFLVSSCYSDILELGPIVPVRRSIRVSHLVEESIDIESSATAEYWDASLCLYLLDDRECLLHKIDYREYLTRIYYIDHMMRDSFCFFRFYLTSSDVHMSVDLT
jgi:hypothetical protein